MSRIVAFFMLCVSAVSAFQNMGKICFILDVVVSVIFIFDYCILINCTAMLTVYIFLHLKCIIIILQYC